MIYAGKSFAVHRLQPEVFITYRNGSNFMLDSFNPFTPSSDQDRISPYNINTISSRQVMRIKKNIH